MWESRRALRAWLKLGIPAMYSSNFQIIQSDMVYNSDQRIPEHTLRLAGTVSVTQATSGP
jgi:hypothetical protein